MGLERFPVKLADPFPDLVRGNANDRIIPCIVIVSAFEDGDPDRTFLELTAVTQERLVDDIA
jgi:hypothetical protein